MDSLLFTAQAKEYFVMFFENSLLNRDVEDVFVYVASYLLKIFDGARLDAYRSLGHMICFRLLIKFLNYYSSGDIDLKGLNKSCDYSDEFSVLAKHFALPINARTFTWKGELKSKVADYTLSETVDFVEHKSIMRSMIRDGILSVDIHGKSPLDDICHYRVNVPGCKPIPSYHLNIERTMELGNKVALEFSEVLISLMKSHNA